MMREIKLWEALAYVSTEAFHHQQLSEFGLINLVNVTNILCHFTLFLPITLPTCVSGSISWQLRRPHSRGRPNSEEYGIKES